MMARRAQRLDRDRQPQGADGRGRAGPARAAAHAATGRGRYRSVLAVFEEQVARGVEIRLLHAGEPSRPFRAELAPPSGPEADAAAARSGSFEMRRCPRVHFKAVVIDGAELYLGSANWTGAGLGAKGEGRRNFELGFLTARRPAAGRDPELCTTTIWRGRACGGCRLRQVCPGPLDQTVTARGRAVRVAKLLSRSAPARPTSGRRNVS